MRTPIWHEHPEFFRGAEQLIADLARGLPASVEHGTGRAARTGSKSAMPSTPASRDRACLARIARRRSPLELDAQRAEIVRIATANGVPVPVPDFTEEQQARQVLAALSPNHRALGWRRDKKGELYDNGGQDDGWDEMDVGLPAPLREVSRR